MNRQKIVDVSMWSTDIATSEMRIWMEFLFGMRVERNGGMAALKIVYKESMVSDIRN